MRIKPEKINKTEVVLLYCQHCINNIDITAEVNKISDLFIKPVMMSCSSKIEVSYLLRLLEAGAEAIEVACCCENKCHFLVGSLRTRKRIDYVRGLLDQIGLGAERIGINCDTGLSPKKLVSLAVERAKAVEPLGPNPMKKGDME